MNKKYKWYLSSIKFGGYSLDTVPVHLRDQKMCVAALRDNPNNMGYIPEEIYSSVRRELGFD